MISTVLDTTSSSVC